ncbi:hypothetical protein SAMN05444166_3123 [Singulisphaera sp. GP187]|nr:hypothetical protein SAMN05444166_3123 [Singulisphaera sp. GP187]
MTANSTNWRLGFLLLTLGHTSGCGPSPGIIAKQDEQRREEYEQQKKNPPGLSEREKRIRQERLELEYGDLAPK